MPKFNYVEYNLENSQLLPLQDNGFQVLLKFIGKTNPQKILFVKSTFTPLGSKLFDIEVTSSLYNNGNSQNGNFNLKLPILDEEKTNPALLMAKVFNQVKTTNLTKTTSIYSSLLSETFSMKIWSNNISKLGSKQDDTTSTSAATTTSCSGCTDLTDGELTGTYSSPCGDCFNIKANTSVSSDVIINGDVIIAGDNYNLEIKNGSLTINGNLTLNNKQQYFKLHNDTNMTVNGTITLVGDFTYFTTSVGSLLTVNGDVHLNGSPSNFKVSCGSIVKILGKINANNAESYIFVDGPYCNCTKSSSFGSKGILTFNSINSSFALNCICGDCLIN